MTSETLHQLNEHLRTAAEAFAGDAFSDLMARFVHDVERAMAEPLEIFPVAHHSPASALHLVRRLQERPPKAIYIELCEDLLPLVQNLAHCKLPVALQAFASESETLPPDALPVTVVAPLTEASAEFQAIAYALTTPDTHLLFVDRAVDYVFQWDSNWKRRLSGESDHSGGEEGEESSVDLHGTAVGVTVGDLMPTFDAFLEFLLRNSNTRHYMEWWEQYVERAIIAAGYDAYRQVMFLIGSLMRHLGRRESDLHEDRLRERFMWTRMKQHMREHHIDPRDAIYICGAAHTASDVEEFGTANALEWAELPGLSSTPWLYGIIPSSFVAIEHQFQHPAGTVSLAETTWLKGLQAGSIRAFDLKTGKPKKQKKANLRAAVQHPHILAAFLTQAPEYAAADHEQLLQWCVDIVALARKNGYLASTADSIAIYETSFLLAAMRNRAQPSPYDFADAAITCLEKDRTPKKRNVAHLCQILLGGDRVGMVGYASLPPLAQNIYDRLEPLGVNLYAKTNQRALLDFKTRPELRDASGVLWKLHYMLGQNIVKPIVGERKLGVVAIQESWDVNIGKHQHAVIQLGYEGVTLEQVLEQRMKRAAFDEKATAALALQTAEDALIYMNSPRLVRELGLHARYLLEQTNNAEEAPEIFQRARRLVHYYRTTPDGLPDWIQQLVATGYAHYASLLPKAFADGGTTPDQIAGMLGFIFTLESLALSLGCQRSQLLIGVQGAALQDIPPDKIGLLWTTEWLLKQRTVATMRAYFHDVLNDALRLPVLPQYLNGFVLSLNFATGMARFVVELLSHIFAAVGDVTLLPWLPGLLIQLRQHQDVLAPLMKEASAVFPLSLAGFANWQPSWLDSAPALQPQQPHLAFTDDERKVRDLLFSHRETANAAAQILGVVPLEWREGASVPHAATPGPGAVRTLLDSAPHTMKAAADLLGNTP